MKSEGSKYQSSFIIDSDFGFASLKVNLFVAYLTLSTIKSQVLDNYLVIQTYL